MEWQVFIGLGKFGKTNEVDQRGVSFLHKHEGKILVANDIVRIRSKTTSYVQIVDLDIFLHNMYSFNIDIVKACMDLNIAMMVGRFPHKESMEC